jgi:hypothetical protein
MPASSLMGPRNRRSAMRFGAIAGETLEQRGWQAIWLDGWREPGALPARRAYPWPHLGLPASLQSFTQRVA